MTEPNRTSIDDLAAKAAIMMEDAIPVLLQTSRSLQDERLKRVLLRMLADDLARISEKVAAMPGTPQMGPPPME